MKMAKMGSSKPPKMNKAVDAPYGESAPSVHLHEGHMKKLGIKHLPKVGSKIKVHAHAKVVSARDSQHGQSLELELHKMGFGGPAEADSAEDAMDQGIDEANEKT